MAKDDRTFMHRDTTYIEFLFLLSIAAICGCDSNTDPANVDDAVMTMPRTVEHPDGRLELEMADLTFLLPADRQNLGITPPNGKPGGGPRVIARRFDGPGLGDPPIYDPNTAKPHQEVLADRIVLRILIDGNAFARQTPANVFGLGPEAPVANRIGQLEGPFENNETGLLEYRVPSTGLAVIHVLPDESRVRSDGYRPYVHCPGSAQHEYGGYRGCMSEVILSPYVKYTYTFTDRWLGRWLEIDGAIQRYVDSLIVEP